FANLYPTKIKTAANVANGIKFKMNGIDSTQTNNKTPCIIADDLDVAPAFALAELRTTTDVIGKPPINELSKLPIPCALSSKLVSVIRRFISNRSDASIQSSVSIDATIAMVAPTIQTFVFKKPSKFGMVIRFLKSSAVCGTGKVTKWSEVIAKA